MLKTAFKQVDWFLIIVLFLLLIFGEFAIYSTSIQKIGDKQVKKDYYIRQLIWISISLVILFSIIFIPQIFIDILITPFYLITILTLVIVLFLPTVKGVHRWISLGNVSIQPSEIAKLATILLVAKLISKRNLTNTKKLFFSLLIVGLPVLLILQEPDLGSALILLSLIIPMIYFAGVPLFTIFLLLTPVISMLVGFSLVLWIIFDVVLLFLLIFRKFTFLQTGLIVAGNAFISFLTPYFWGILKGYQQERILTFIYPSRDMLGSGYQIIQSKIAIGSGGIFGKGYLNGTQKNLDFLPEKHTDFIFSVIGEELGFVGCFLLIILFILLFYRGLIILKSLPEKSKFKKIAVAGIISYILFQTIVNIGMNVGIFPVVGIPLPFISYGGSSLIINVAAIAFLVKFKKEKSFIYI